MRGDSGGRVVLGAGSHHLDKNPPPPLPPVLGGVANLADGDVPLIPREAGGGGLLPTCVAPSVRKAGVFLFLQAVFFKG